MIGFQTCFYKNESNGHLYKWHMRFRRLEQHNMSMSGCMDDNCSDIDSVNGCKCNDNNRIGKELIAYGYVEIAWFSNGPLFLRRDGKLLQIPYSYGR